MRQPLPVDEQQRQPVALRQPGHRVVERGEQFAGRQLGARLDRRRAVRLGLGALPPLAGYEGIAGDAAGGAEQPAGQPLRMSQGTGSAGQRQKRGLERILRGRGVKRPGTDA
ncbi:MAG: hypothetical protein U0746_04060 [Gemmataceae bacterium]